MTMLNPADDAGTQMAKMLAATNEVVNLTKDLIASGQILNDAKGKYQEIKAKIKAQKEVINSLKTIIKAEGSHL